MDNSPDQGRILGSVLVVDDDPAIRILVTAVLTEHGYLVKVAPDGLAGVRLAARWLPDIVLMDLTMPGLDGWNARRLMERGESTADIPVVLVTGSCDEGERASVRGEGFIDLLRKPFTRERLLAVVEQALRSVSDSRAGRGDSANAVPAHDAAVVGASRGFDVPEAP